jgi:hypothetical protein
VPDEQTPGQPTPVEPSPAPVETAPATEPTPETPALPDKFRGQSAEDIARAYLEIEKEKGRLAQEVGELRQRIPQYQPQPPAYFPPQFTQPEVRPEFDYGKPEESIDRIVERRLEQERQQRAMYDVQRQEQEARLNYESGKEIALKSNARLYEGIEPLVEQAVQMAYRQYGLHPAALRDPKVWERAALNIRWDRGEVDRLSRPTPQPPIPSATGVPNQTRQAKAGVELDDDSRRLAKELGLTEQEAKEIIEKESGGGR